MTCSSSSVRLALFTFFSPRVYSFPADLALALTIAQLEIMTKVQLKYWSILLAADALALKWYFFSHFYAFSVWPWRKLNFCKSSSRQRASAKIAEPAEGRWKLNQLRTEETACTNGEQEESSHSVNTWRFRSRRFTGERSSSGHWAANRLSRYFG